MSKWNKQSINPSEGTAPTQWDDFFPPLEYQQPGVDLLQNLAWPASEALARPTGPSQQAMHTPPRAESSKSPC